MKSKKNIKLAIFCDDTFGIEVLEYIKSKKKKIDLIVYNNKNTKIKNEITRKYSDHFVIGSNKIYLKKTIKKFKELNIDIIILAWWPYIIKEPYLSLANRYIVNMHPSYLPNGRGKHPYCWSIIENTTFGVSLHLVNSEIDGGKIFARDTISINWEENGYTLREKSRAKLLELFKNNFSKIIENKLTFIKHSSNKKIHYSSELEEKSRIKLEKRYSARELLDLIRARSGFQKGGSWFIDKNAKYHVKTVITRVKNEEK